MHGAERAGIVAEAGVALKDQLRAKAEEEGGGKVLTHYEGVDWCAGSVLPGHIKRDRVASHHLHRPAKTSGPH